ncbi:hypothetical protein [Rhodoligotrophos ferricapiens]|uniref:hypothetical protein n=1 Tax=Rhodoligotrophos ferricapiens TaxID=3069264 RepID=UPI00315D6905
MFETVAFLAFTLAGTAGLFAMGLRDQRQARAARARLLDDAAGAIGCSRTSLGPDGFPILTGCLADGRGVRITLIHDTLVTRRLPQLWLSVTLADPDEQCPRIGILARPTGAEFYSAVHAMPSRFDPPPPLDPALLIRGGSETDIRAVRMAAPLLAGLFADPKVKEAVVAPSGVRIIRQVAQGDRAAHVVLRQARYEIARVPRDLIHRSLAEADALSAIFRRPHVLQRDAEWRSVFEEESCSSQDLERNGGAPIPYPSQPLSA